MAVASDKPRDADVYDLLQREKKRREHGAYSRTARAFGRSHEFVRKVEARYTPVPELVYLPPPDAYPEPVKPATEPLLQELLDAEPATEAAINLQLVMSSSVQLATDATATMQFVNMNRYVRDFQLPPLQIRPRMPVESCIGLLMLPTGALTLVNAVRMLLLDWWLGWIIGVLLACAALGLLTCTSRLLDLYWEHWRGWLVVAGLAALVVALGVATR